MEDKLTGDKYDDYDKEYIKDLEEGTFVDTVECSRIPKMESYPYDKVASGVLNVLGK